MTTAVDTRRPSAQILAEFAKEIDPALLVRRDDGFDYVPWYVNKQQMDDIVGPENWENLIPMGFYAEGKGFCFVSTITVHAKECDITRSSIGYAEIFESGGGHSFTKRQACGADRNGLNRAMAMFGPRFGGKLYEKADEEKPSDGGGRRTYTPASSSSGGEYTGPRRKTPTSAMIKALKNLKVSDEEIEDMTFEQASARIGVEIARIEAEKKRKGGGSRGPKTERSEADLPLD